MAQREGISGVREVPTTCWDEATVPFRRCYRQTVCLTYFCGRRQSQL